MITTTAKYGKERLQEPESASSYQEFQPEIFSRCFIGEYLLDVLLFFLLLQPS